MECSVRRMMVRGCISRQVSMIEVDDSKLTADLEGQLWDSLTRDSDEIPSPDWHQDVLTDRKARAQRGEAKFLTLAQLRSRIRSSEP